MASVEAVTDYIISRVSEEARGLSILKLQKLLYYSQAWYLVYHDARPLFEEDFQAWIHGPVCRSVYDRFNQEYRLYDIVSLKDVQSPPQLGEEETAFINEVLDVYAVLTGSQLESLTHQEEPWIAAREGLPLTARCENIISKQSMARYYGARVGIKYA